MGNIQCLPSDIFFKIALQLTNKDLFAVSLSCKQLNNFFNLEELFMHKVHGEYGITTKDKETWKLTYIEPPMTYHIESKSKCEAWRLVETYFLDKNIEVIMGISPNYFTTLVIANNQLYTVKRLTIFDKPLEFPIKNDYFKTMKVTHVATWDDNQLYVVADDMLYIVDPFDQFIAPFKFFHLNGKKVTQSTIGSHEISIIADGKLYHYQFMKRYMSPLFGFADYVFRRVLYNKDPIIINELENVTFVKTWKQNTFVIANKMLYSFGKDEYGLLSEDYQFEPKLLSQFNNVTLVTMNDFLIAIVSDGFLYIYSKNLDSKMLGKQELFDKVTDINIMREVMDIGMENHSIYIISRQKLYKIEFIQLQMNEQRFAHKCYQMEQFCCAKRFLKIGTYRLCILGLQKKTS